MVTIRKDSDAAASLGTTLGMASLPMNLLSRQDRVDLDDAPFDPGAHSTASGRVAVKRHQERDLRSPVFDPSESSRKLDALLFHRLSFKRDTVGSVGIEVAPDDSLPGRLPPIKGITRAGNLNHTVGLARHPSGHVGIENLEQVTPRDPGSHE